jgi:hypothetical protein
MTPLTRRQTPTVSDRPENQRIEPGDAERGEVEIVHEHQLAAGKTARFFNDLVRIRTPTGEYQETRQLRLRRSVDHDDGVVAVPIRDSDDRILLVRQFRHATRMWLRELPRGARDRGESVDQAVRREVHEETGYAVTSLRPSIG